MKLFKSRDAKKSEKRDIDSDAVEIARLAQGTPIVGYHDKDGRLIIPAEYDDEYEKD